MAVTEDVSALSTTQGSNTPAQSDNVGTDLDDHLRNIKQNIRKTATHFVEDGGDTTLAGTDGILHFDISATPTMVAKYHTGVGVIPVFEVDKSASGSYPYFGQSLLGPSTDSAMSTLGFSPLGRSLATATSTAAHFTGLGVSQTLQDALTATDTAALHAVIGVGTTAGDLVETITGSATSIAALPVLSGEFLTNVGAVWKDSSSATTTSGSTVDITGLTAGLNEVHLVLSGVSQDTADTELIVQLGDSGGFETTGYAGSILQSVVTQAGQAMSEGFALTASTYFDAATIYTGEVKLTHMGANIWSCTCTGSPETGSVLWHGQGVKTLSGELTQVRLTTVAGTATFDAGIMYLVAR